MLFAMSTVTRFVLWVKCSWKRCFNWHKIVKITTGRRLQVVEELKLDHREKIQLDSGNSRPRPKHLITLRKGFNMRWTPYFMVGKYTTGFFRFFRRIIWRCCMQQYTSLKISLYLLVQHQGMIRGQFSSDEVRWPFLKETCHFDKSVEVT